MLFGYVVLSTAQSFSSPLAAWLRPLVSPGSLCTPLQPLLSPLLPNACTTYLAFIIHHLVLWLIFLQVYFASFIKRTVNTAIQKCLTDISWWHSLKHLRNTVLTISDHSWEERIPTYILWKWKLTSRRVNLLPLDSRAEPKWTKNASLLTRSIHRTLLL